MDPSRWPPTRRVRLSSKPTGSLDRAPAWARQSLQASLVRHLMSRQCTDPVSWRHYGDHGRSDNKLARKDGPLGDRPHASARLGQGHRPPASPLAWGLYPLDRCLPPAPLLVRGKNHRPRLLGFAALEPLNRAGEPSVFGQECPPAQGLESGIPDACRPHLAGQPDPAGGPPSGSCQPGRGLGRIGG